MEFVDIIIANYNSHKTLKKTITSVFAQTYKNWKLFIVDDNSNNQTINLLKKYKNNKKIKIFYLNKNMGAGYCRNLAIKNSTSKFISFLDSDDLWNKNKLKHQIDFMKKNNYKFTYTWYLAFKDKSKYLKKIKAPLKFNYNSFIKNTSIGTSTMIIERTLSNNINFINTKICEDYFYKCKLLKKNNFAHCLPLFLTKYRITKNSLQSNKLKNLYWIWQINKKYNNLNFIKNLISIFFISLNSLKKYGFK